MNRSLAAACVALFAGCSGITGICTLVDCDSGLFVQLAQTPTGPYRIEVFSGEDTPDHVFDCENPSLCYPKFIDYTPELVKIRVTTSAGTREQTAKPKYSVWRPNGPHCEPACKSATVTVALPS